MRFLINVIANAFMTKLKKSKLITYEEDDIKPILYIIVPCYNEEEVLPLTSNLFSSKIEALIQNGKISAKSRIMLVNDGSSKNTWDIICALPQNSHYFLGISQSRNRGHQNTVLAGLLEAKER